MWAMFRLTSKYCAAVSQLFRGNRWADQCGSLFAQTGVFARGHVCDLCTLSRRARKDNSQRITCGKKKSKGADMA